MTCPTCATDNPEVSLFCHRCGETLRGGSRAGSYAVQASEGVNQFALISTIMPHTNQRTGDNYRWAMILSGVLVLGATGFGLLPIAVSAAAFLVPLAYLVYVYDVNLWEDAPVKVVAALFVVTGALAVVVSLFFFRWVFEQQYLDLALGSTRSGFDGLPVTSVLIFSVLLPIVAEVVKNLPGVLLARLPQFDDMIDGLTFGVAAGTAYAALETIVLFSSVFTDGDFRTTSGLATWFVVIVNLMIVKSLIYGTATGIAVAAFSGKGEGYDGFTPAYLRNLGLAMAANVAYLLGVRLLSFVPFGQALGLIWGLVVLGVLVLRVRVMMQASLLEAAVEDAARSGTKRETFVESFCGECENMLLTGSRFCLVCGTSVAASSHQARTASGADRSQQPEGVA